VGPPAGSPYRASLAAKTSHGLLCVDRASGGEDTVEGGEDAQDNGGTVWQRRTLAASDRPPGGPRRPRTRPRRLVRRSGNARRSSATTWRRFSTRSMRSSRKMPRSSSAPTSRRAGSNPRGARWAHPQAATAARAAVGSQAGTPTTGRNPVGADYLGGQFTAACLRVGTSSFADFLASSAPDLLPGAMTAGPAGQPAAGPGAGGQPGAELPHGTTIVAADFSGGVIMAGDRRSIAGNVIAQRDIEKVFRSDDFSCVGIAGVAGVGLELVRLFQLELEHYEKLEGQTLSLEGKANRLAAFVRGNLG